MKKIFRRIGQFFNRLFQSKPTEPIKDIILSDESLSKDLVRITFVKNMRAFEGQKETHGSNRSPWIDMINKWIGVSLGSPYCMTSICYALNQTEKELKIKIDLPRSASTQTFFNKTKSKYKVQHPDYGLIGIQQSKENKSQGHALVCLTKQDPKGNFQTTECNTNALGSRDGQGCMLNQRNIKGDSLKKFLGYVDVGLAAIIE